MSTKIYEAYRVPLNKLQDALSFFRENFMSVAIEKTKRAMDLIDESVVKKEMDKYIAEYPSSQLLTLNDNQERLNKTVRAYMIFSLYIMSSKKSITDANIDSFVKVFLDKSYAYFYAVGPLRRNDSGIKDIPEYFKDFSYWNNTDKPDEITDREWSFREKKWDMLLERDRPNLVYEILLMKNPTFTFYNIYDLCSKIIGVEDAFHVYHLAEDYLEKKESEKKEDENKNTCSACGGKGYNVESVYGHKTEETPCDKCKKEGEL